MIPTNKQLALRSQFIHRHDKFKPTAGNLLLLGFAAGAAVVVIVFVICAALS
jgi:hypothetical protein